jgi:hypothetical protein
MAAKRGWRYIGVYNFYTHFCVNIPARPQTYDQSAVENKRQGSGCFVNLACYDISEATILSL